MKDFTQSSISKKYYKGDFIEPTEWIGKSMQIGIDLTRSNIEISSKTMLDRDQFKIEEKISITSNKNNYITAGDNKILIVNCALSTNREYSN
ncbi:MAG: hypothetical protein ABIS69_08780 [Sediminibacterium sp.]